ncbi:hypothetical protein TNCV_4939851 [Trichonephila clavipes]|nr:hypothetical protein TNCV_4939851 [Trichonephila clavipes]
MEKEEVEEEKVCECRHFQPMPREMYGRRKVREGFYDSVFEKFDMWEEGIDDGLGKDVSGIIQRYLKGNMSFVFGPPAQELQLLHTVPSIFDGDLISFLDELERAPMDLTMLRLNSCVKKSIGFKAIQPMDLSVNSCL